MLVWLAAPSVSRPVLCAVLKVPASAARAAPRASKKIDPLLLTLVVADTRPSWLTARPTNVMLPRGAAMSPLAALVAAMLLAAAAAVALLPMPVVAALPLPISTSRPRVAGLSGLVSDA